MALAISYALTVFVIIRFSPDSTVASIQEGTSLIPEYPTGRALGLSLGASSVTLDPLFFHRLTSTILFMGTLDLTGIL